MRARKRSAPRSWKLTFGELTLLVDRLKWELTRMVYCDDRSGP